MERKLKDLKPGDRFQFLKNGRKGNTQYILDKKYICNPGMLTINYNNGSGTYYSKILNADQLIYIECSDTLEMKVKYVRVSTSEQNTARQQINKKDFDKIYVDKVSGIVPFFERAGAKKLIADIESGIIKEIHASSIDRLGRNIIDILTVIEYFDKKNISLFIENIGMYSRTSMGKNSAFSMIVSVLANVAEMERENIKERQREGIAIAKAKGVYHGRKQGTELTDDQLLEKYKPVVKELKSGESIRRTAKLCQVSPATVQKIKKILNS